MARLPIQRLAPYAVAAGLLLSGGVLAGCGAAASAAGDGGASTAATTTSAADAAASQTSARSGAAQRQATFQADIKSALDGLVQQGTLNATQEQSALSALTQRPAGAFSRGSASRSSASRTSAATTGSGTAGGGRGAGQRAGGQQAFEKRALDPLVQQGTLTADQETAIVQAVQQTMAAHRPSGAPAPQGGGNGQG